MGCSARITPGQRPSDIDLNAVRRVDRGNPGQPGRVWWVVAASQLTADHSASFCLISSME